MRPEESYSLGVNQRNNCGLESGYRNVDGNEYLFAAAGAGWLPATHSPSPHSDLQPSGAFLDQTDAWLLGQLLQPSQPRSTTSLGNRTTSRESAIGDNEAYANHNRGRWLDGFAHNIPGEVHSPSSGARNNSHLEVGILQSSLSAARGFQNGFANTESTQKLGVWDQEPSVQQLGLGFGNFSAPFSGDVLHEQTGSSETWTRGHGEQRQEANLRDNDREEPNGNCVRQRESNIELNSREAFIGGPSENALKRSISANYGRSHNTNYGQDQPPEIAPPPQPVKPQIAAIGTMAQRRGLMLQSPPQLRPIARVNEINNKHDDISEDAAEEQAPTESRKRTRTRSRPLKEPAPRKRRTGAGAKKAGDTDTAFLGTMGAEGEGCGQDAREGVEADGPQHSPPDTSLLLANRNPTRFRERADQLSVLMCSTDVAELVPAPPSKMNWGVYYSGDHSVGLTTDESGQKVLLFGETATKYLGDENATRQCRVYNPKVATLNLSIMAFRQYLIDVLPPEEVQHLEKQFQIARETILEVLLDMDYDELCLQEQIRDKQTQFLGKFADTIVVPTCFFNRAGVICGANDSLCEMLKISKKDTLSTNYFQLVHPSTLYETLNTIFSALQVPGKTKQMMVDITLRRMTDNRPIPVRVALNVCRDIFGVSSVYSAIHHPYSFVALSTSKEVKIF